MCVIPDDLVMLSFSFVAEHSPWDVFAFSKQIRFHRENICISVFERMYDWLSDADFVVKEGNIHTYAEWQNLIEFIRKEIEIRS